MKCIFQAFHFQMVFIDIFRNVECVCAKADAIRIDIGKLISLEMISIKAYLPQEVQEKFS